MTKFLIAAAAVTCMTAPAFARTAAPAPAPVSSATVAPTQRICVVADVTGSHIPYRDCRTKADWDKAGIDPLATDK